MGRRLLGWARAVKARRRGAAPLPVLWLFTDAARLPDPRPAIARLPKGLSGVVFRHDGAADRAALARDVARLCRARRIALVVAGDARLAAEVGAGLHLRGGRRAQGYGGAHARHRRLVTASAHTVADLRQARRAGARLCFLSPVFPTASHPNAAALGPLRWSAMARQAADRHRGTPGKRTLGTAIMALGGIDDATVIRLPRLCAGIGAIGALA
jgi:thiamine-phosphate pyrophosphorylase